MKSLKPFVSKIEDVTYTVYAKDEVEAKNNFIAKVKKGLHLEEKLEVAFKELTHSHITVDVH